VKGQSGNPSGAKIITVDPKSLYGPHAKAVSQRLVAMIHDENTPASARIAAIKEFNDRFYGRAIPTIEKKDIVDAIIDVSTLSPEALAEISKIGQKGAN